jgi:hypothetical protein
VTSVVLALLSAVGACTIGYDTSGIQVVAGIAVLLESVWILLVSISCGVTPRLHCLTASYQGCPKTRGGTSLRLAPIVAEPAPPPSRCWATPSPCRVPGDHSPGPSALLPPEDLAHAGAVEDALAYLAAAITGIWGIAHAVPTPQVVAGFEPITRDNRRVILQEWLAEAVTMWGLAVLVIAVTAVDADANVTAWVYRVAAGILVTLAVLTGATGARTAVIWFKICPALLTSSAVLLLVASFA